MSCPTDYELIKHAKFETPEAEREGLREHIDECEECAHKYTGYWGSVNEMSSTPVSYMEPMLDSLLVFSKYDYVRSFLRPVTSETYEKNYD